MEYDKFRNWFGYGGGQCGSSYSCGGCSSITDAIPKVEHPMLRDMTIDYTKRFGRPEITEYRTKAEKSEVENIIFDHLRERWVKDSKPLSIRLIDGGKMVIRFESLKSVAEEFKKDIGELLDGEDCYIQFYIN